MCADVDVDLADPDSRFDNTGGARPKAARPSTRHNLLRNDTYADDGVRFRGHPDVRSGDGQPGGESPGKVTNGGRLSPHDPKLGHGTPEAEGEANASERAPMSRTIRRPQSSTWRNTGASWLRGRASSCIRTAATEPQPTDHRAKDTIGGNRLFDGGTPIERSGKDERRPTGPHAARHEDHHPAKTEGAMWPPEV